MAGKMHGDGLKAPTQYDRHTPEQAYEVIHSMLAALKDLSDQGYYYDQLKLEDMRKVQDGNERYVAMAAAFRKTASVGRTPEARMYAQTKGIRDYIKAYFKAEIAESERVVTGEWKLPGGSTKYLMAPPNNDALFHLGLMLEQAYRKPFSSIDEMFKHPYITKEPFKLSKDVVEGLEITEQRRQIHHHLRLEFM